MLTVGDTHIGSEIGRCESGAAGGIISARRTPAGRTRETTTPRPSGTSSVRQRWGGGS